MLNTMNTRREIIKDHKHLVIIALCFLVVMFTSLKHVWSVFIPYVEAEFKVTRTVSILPFSLFNIANIIGFLSTGYLKERLGLRRLLTVTNVLMTLGLVLAALSPNIVVLIVSFAFIHGLGHSFGYVIAVSLGVRWFRGRRAGTATGIIVGAYSFGILVLSPLTSYLIQYSGSWRTPLLIYSLVVFTIMLAATMILREPPVQELGDRTRSQSLVRIARSREFALIATALFSSTLFDGLIAGNFIPLVREMAGVDPITASLVMSIYSVVALASRVAVGVISEHLGVLRTLITVYTIASIDALLFASYGNLPLITLGVSVSALLFSANVTLSPLIASLIWGTRNLEAAYSLLLTAIVCGVLVGPVIGGLSRDLTRSYYPGITITAIALLLGTLTIAYTIKKYGGVKQ